MRFIGLDVHKDFCEVAVVEDHACRSGPRVRSTPEDLEVFGQSLGRKDHVVLEATGGALAIARILERYAGRVVMANPMAVRAIASAKAKTDRLDARTLAKLLAAGFLPAVWMGDERTRLLRRLVSRHAQLITQRTRAKNQIHAVLQRTLKGRPPASDLFGKRGRAWLDDQDLPADERETVQASLRHVDFLDGELRLVDRTIAQQVLDWPEVRRIMTIPGMGATAAAGVMAAIGDVRRFPTPRHLVGYLGLDARVRQSGSSQARHGGISKQGSSEARHLLVEAAWAAIRTPGPLRAFGERIRARRGANIATVAVARKLAILCWHLLTREEDYAFARPSLVRQKVRLLELAAGAPNRNGYRNPVRVFATPAQHRLEREVGAQAEKAYRRFVKDFLATGKKGAGAITGARISVPRKGQAPRQEQAPDPAL
ncbi:MAG: IS110 family transposase [Actinomycetota bacterium]